MDRRQIALQLVIQQFSKYIKTTDRGPVFQDLLFLLQEKGFPAVYRCGWGAKGPFLLDYADDFRENESHTPTSEDEWELTPAERKLVDQVIHWYKLHIYHVSVRPEHHLRIISAVYFLIRTGQGKIDAISDMVDVLRASGIEVTPLDVVWAINDLSKLELVESKPLLSIVVERGEQPDNTKPATVNLSANDWHIVAKLLYFGRDVFRPEGVYIADCNRLIESIYEQLRDPIPEPTKTD